MTSPLRRKRPITAPNTPPATEKRGRTPFLALALVVGLVSAAQAAPLAQPSTLKWRTRGASGTVKPKAAASDAPQVKSKSAGGATPASNKSSRARVRDSIMQVSAYQDPDDPLAAPQFDELPPPGEPAMNEPSFPADETVSPTDVPAPGRFDDDPLSDDPPRSPSSELPEPPGDLSTGIETPVGDAGCKKYSSECERAIQDLQRMGDIKSIVVGVLIEGVEGTDFPCDCKIGRDFEAPQFAGRNFCPTLFTWKATGTCHKPLYFEDVQLERYGHSWNPVVQPFVSAAHFFVSVPLLPYKMGLTPPNECIYTLGYYRPGSCAPYMFEPIPLSVRAAAYQAVGATAFAFWFWPPH